MGRIRTIKPEFWEDEKVGLLSREARLLMLATFNLADDEGLLRWTPAYIKASVFMYDEDITPAKAEKTMKELAESGIIFPYSGGISQQPLAIIVNFRKHQKINRPQPGKLPAPSIQNSSVKSMYARRDGWICSLCGLPISNPPTNNDSLNLSLDHIIHASKGGGDYPSNIRATHQACNKGRRDRDDETFTTPHSVLSMFNSVNNSGTQSLPEGKGREGIKEGIKERKGGEQERALDAYPARPVNAETSDGSELAAANWLCQEANLPLSMGARQQVALSLRCVANEGGTMETASQFMLQAVISARERGEKINRFWFEEEQYKPKIVPSGVSTEGLEDGV